MIYFLQPLWLFAGLALTVPLVIHLLSRRSGKRIKVGSIKLLDDSQSQQWKSLKLNEAALLILRAALLTVLVLLLAQPHLKNDSTADDSSNQSWALIAPSLLSSPLKAVGLESVLDSLASAGYELRVLGPDFPPLSSFDAKINSSDEEDYWSLLREVDAIASAEAPLWVFTDDHLQNFRGERPALSNTVQWRTISSQRENRWIQNAWRTKNDSACLVIGFSDFRQTFFARYDVNVPTRKSILSESGMPAIEVIPNEDGHEFRMKLLQSDDHPDDDGFTLRDKEPQQNVLILHDVQREEDAKYVKFAFHVVAEYFRIPLEPKTEILKDGTRKNRGANIIFWLSSHPTPDDLLRSIEINGFVLVNDASTHEYERCKTEMIIESATSRPRLWRRINSTQQGFAVWTDGFGSPLLECEPLGEGWHYRFFSRYHPLWNELVLSPEFPEWIASLLDHNKSFASYRESDLGFSDQRRISAAQMMPAHRASEAQLISTSSSESLHLPVCILAALLFMLERWMAARQST